MCVISVCETHRPSPEMVKAMWASNPRGGGVAWRDTIKVKGGGGATKTIVRWKKGMDDVDEMVELAAKLPLPFVQHFRIPSVGGPTLDLTHPFPVMKDVPLLHEGMIDGQVLFHNGTWSRWDSESIKAGLSAKVKLPRGPFSDSRMMAWMTFLVGPGFLDMLDEKVILFGPEDVEIFGHKNGWAFINNIWCSNGGFKHHMDPPRRETTEMGPRPLRQIAGVVDQAVSGGDRRPAGFRGGPSMVGAAGPEEEGADFEEPTEGSEKGPGDRVKEGVVCVVEGIGQRPRHPLVEDDGFTREYRKIHGHPPPFRAKEWPAGMNPKRYHSSGKVGIDPATRLTKRQQDAEKGISHVIM